MVAYALLALAILVATAPAIVCHYLAPAAPRRIWWATSSVMFAGLVGLAAVVLEHGAKGKGIGGRRPIAITRRAEVYDLQDGQSLGTVWLEDGEIKYSEGNNWVRASIYVRLAKTPEERFEALLGWSNGYTALREVPVE